MKQNHFLLSNVENLPFRDITSFAQERVLVVAPHPDDETLGCGGAIALLRNKGYDVKVLVISDGTLSHPNSQKFPAPVLQSIREQETLKALKILGVKSKAITFLRFKDGSVPTPSSSQFQEAKVLCRNYLEAFLPNTIFIPWRSDPHADHRATYSLIEAALLGIDVKPQRIEYPIWDWDIPQQKEISDTSRIVGWRLNTEVVLQQKRQAIAAYRSQLGQLIDDDPQGFCLSVKLLANFTRSWEVYFEEIL